MDRARKAKDKVISIVNSGTKRRSTSTHRRSGRAQKAHKLDPDTTTPPAPPHLDEGTEDVGAPFHRTPATKRMASHAGLIEQGNIIYAQDMETQIAAEARGVTRKNIPQDTFRSIYLRDFSVKAQPKLAVKSVKKIGQGNWEEKLFWDQFCKVLSKRSLFQVRVRSICLSVLC